MATATKSSKARPDRSLPAPSPALPMYRLSVEQYHGLIEAGVLHSGDRVELLEGWLIAKMTRNPPHPGTIQLVQAALLARLPGEWTLRVQSAITTSDSEPEPDLAVARGPVRRYLRKHPRPADLALVVEVAGATVEEDRHLKGRIYARAGLPVYWVVNLIDSRVEVYTEPRGGRAPVYRKRQDYGSSDAVPLVVAGNRLGAIPVRELLP
jgi:Uma2 family endonuclease